MTDGIDSAEDRLFRRSRTLNVKGRLLSLEHPLVMGILNATPDSFYDGGKHDSVGSAMRQMQRMIEEGADIIDVGGASSRPGAEAPSEQEEINRVTPVIQAAIETWPDVIISIDTYRSSVAQAALEAGASIVNDISGGMLDEQMLSTVGQAKAPYICMHMPGTPKDMQQNTDYPDGVVHHVFKYFSERIATCLEAGIHDIILDPGFGFGKTMDQNYRLLRELEHFRPLQRPILMGVSRKSMIHRTLGTSASEALNGTTALHMLGLERGADILRVHDVKEAKECITLHQRMKSAP